jgi:hypothetical protein
VKKLLALNIVLIIVVSFELTMLLIGKEYGWAVFAAVVLGINLTLPFALSSMLTTREAVATARAFKRLYDMKEAEADYWKKEAID